MTHDNYHKVILVDSVINTRKSPDYTCRDSVTGEPLRPVTIVGPELANSPKSDGRVDDPRVLSYRFFAKKRMGELCWSSFLSLLQKARPSNFNKNRLLALRRVGEKAIHTSTIMIDPRTRDLSFKCWRTISILEGISRGRTQYRQRQLQVALKIQKFRRNHFLPSQFLCTVPRGAQTLQQSQRLLLANIFSNLALKFFKILKIDKKYY